jgi:hypothetical protein
MTWPRVEALLDYWRDCPPTHILAAGYLGYKPRAREMSVEDVRKMRPPAGSLSIEELKALAPRVGLPG